MRQLNFIYLLGPAHLSGWQNNEIRYSLRSLEAAFNPDWVGITGPEIPAFLTGITHFKVDILPDMSRYKNMQRQLLAACTVEETPEELVLMNDDFLVRSSPQWNWISTHTGLIGAVPTSGAGWRRSVVATGEWLRAKGVANPISYEGHTPMPFLKSRMLPILQELLTSNEPLQLRSAYGNIVGVGGFQHPNAKRGDPDKWPTNSPFWSLKRNVSQKAKIFLENWLPNPSRWEVKNEISIL